MSLIRINHNPSRCQLAVFGVIWLVFFSAVGGIVLSGSGSMGAAVALWTAAVAVPAIGWMAPEFLRIVNLGMVYAAFPIGLVVSNLILAMIYYLVLTPIGLVTRLFGYDPMNRHFDGSADTYWCPREQDDSLNRYFQQF